MVDIDFIYIQVVENQETFIDPLGYEMSGETIIGYIDLLLKSENDQVEYRFGTYDEIT